MQASDRPAFETMLAELFGALDKPLTEAKREGFWKALSAMSLVDFGRARDKLLADLEDTDGTVWKSFSAGDIWRAKKSLRAKAPEPQHMRPAVDASWSAWAMTGNRHLMRLVMKLPQLGKLPRHDSPELEPFTRRMVDAKNRWVADMEDLDRGEGVPREIQRNVWKDYLGFTGAVA